MKASIKADIQKAVTKGAMPHFTPDAAREDFECPVYSRPTKEGSGYTIHAMPSFEFSIDASLDFWPTEVSLSFNIRYLGCEWNNDDQEWDWGGKDFVVNMDFCDPSAPNIPTLAWFDHPVTFGSKSNDDSCNNVKWHHQGVEGLESKENKIMANEVVTVLLNALDADEKSSLLYAVFDRAKHSLVAYEDIKQP